MAASFRMNNQEYVILSLKEYERLGGAAPAGAVEAAPYIERSIANGLRAARRSAGLTQSQLAARMGKSQAMISAAENARVRVGERFIKAVLRACHLPADWKPPAELRPSGHRRARAPR